MTAALLSRADLRTLFRNRFGDIGTGYSFTDAQIDYWINASISEYNIHFPRRKTAVITVVASQQVYILPYDCRGISSVTYATFGGSFPENVTSLNRRPYTHPDFWRDPGYYDLMKTDESADAELPQLLITTKPGNSVDTITVRYSGDHPQLASDTDKCTIPPRHIDLLNQYALLCALQELSTDESRNPDPIHPMISQLEMNVNRAERMYRAALNDALAAESEAAVMEWKMDKWDRSY